MQQPFIAVLILAFTSVAQAAEQYSFTAIDHPNATTMTWVLGLNNHGDVSGMYDAPDGTMHGYARIKGVFHSIDVPDAKQTACGGIRDDRQVTGTFTDAQGFQHGFQWKAGKFTIIDVPGAAQTTDIAFEFGTGLGTASYRTNSKGVVIGQYADAAGYGHGYAFHHGKLKIIDFPGAFHVPGFDTTTIAINNHGVIGGSYTSEASPIVHGFIYKKGKFTKLDVPEAGGYFGTQVNGLNNKGVAVGPYSDSNNAFHGFIWRKGVFTTVDAPGSAGFSEIDSINDRGDISGEWLDANGVIHGYVGKLIKKSKSSH